MLRQGESKKFPTSKKHVVDEDNDTTTKLLKEIDKECTEENLDKFKGLLYEIMQSLGIIVSSEMNMVDCLKKVENQLNHFIEARNHLFYMEQQV